MRYYLYSPLQLLLNLYDIEEAELSFLNVFSLSNIWNILALCALTSNLCPVCYSTEYWELLGLSEPVFFKGANRFQFAVLTPILLRFPSH